MLAQVLPAAQQPPLERPLADCRVYERRSCAVPTTCQPASVLEMHEMRWAATIADISQGGVRLLLQRRFEKGAGLAIELPGDGVREPTPVFVKVVHVSNQQNGTWSLGCRFISELSEDEMNRLLTSTHHVLSSPKQKYLDDQQANPPAEAPSQHFLSDVYVQVEVKPGSVVECVIRRLNVTKSWPLTPGKVLSLNGKTRDNAPWALRIQIAQCTQRPKGWEIQGRAIDSTTASGVQRALSAD